MAPAQITLHAHSFVLYQADEYTLALMESEAELHPMSDIDYILQQLRAALSAEQKDSLQKRCVVSEQHCILPVRSDASVLRSRCCSLAL